MLDLSAAFDTIDHQKLLSRLENHFGITGTPLKWMNSYLSEHYQTVYIDSELSKPVRMTYRGPFSGPKTKSYTPNLSVRSARNTDLTITFMLMTHNST